jgi:hypothetical protein
MALLHYSFALHGWGYLLGKKSFWNLPEMCQANRITESSGGVQTWTEASHCNSAEFLVTATETVVLLAQQRRRRVPVVILDEDSVFREREMRYTSVPS